MPPPVLVGWTFPAGVPTFWAPSTNVGPPPIDGQGDSVCVVAYDIPLPSLYATRVYYYNSWDEAQPPVVETPAYFIAKFTPAKPPFLQAASLLYYTPDAEDVPAGVAPQEGLEGEPHFVAKFTPAKLTVPARLLYQQAEFNPPVQETNVHTIGRFAPVKLSRFAFNSWDQAQPPVTETNIHSIGFFKNPPRWSFKLNSWDQSQPPVVETNVHTIGTFKPAKLTVSPLLYQQLPDIEPPQSGPGDSIYVVSYRFDVPSPQASHLYYFQQPEFKPAVAETNTNFLAAFKPARLTVSPLLYQQKPNLDVSVVATQPETNTHFLAGFKPVKLTVLPLLRFSLDQAQPSVTETNTHFVAKFKQTPTWRFAYNSWDQSQPPVAETNVHFIGTFRPVKLCISPLLRQHYQTDLSAPAVTTPGVGDSISVISYRFDVPSPQASSLYYFQQPTPESTAVVVQPTTNQHYLARFNPARLAVSSLYRQHGHEDALPPVVETNVHTIGRFTSIRLVVPAFLRQHYPGDLTAGFIPQEPFVANSHYLATFKQTKIISFAYNSTDTSVAQAETNVHFIGRFRQVSTWRFNYNTRADDPAVVETNTHFVARFTAAQLKRFAFNSWDTSVPQVETNPHHVGRFTPAKLGRFGYNTRADDPPVVETNPHQVGSFRPTKITKLALLWNNPAADIFVAEPPGRVANPHFVGRFTQPKFLSFHFNTPDTQVPPIPEFWITAGARNLTATDAERALVATDQVRHLTATDTGRNLTATGSARNRIATWN